MIVALPMYDEGRASAANDALWRIWVRMLGGRGIHAPESLDRSGSPWAVWKDPALLMAQTCSLPYVDFLEGSVRIFAFPQYSAAGCGEATYSSVIVVRSDLPGEDLAEFAGSTVAVNDRRSQSGYATLLMELERRGLPIPYFGRARLSGSHSASIRMLAEGAADIAAIDCVSFAHFQRNGDPDTGAVRVIGRTPEAPAPPYITSGNREPELSAILHESLRETIAEPEGPSRLRSAIPHGSGCTECRNPCRNGSGSLRGASSAQGGNRAGLGNGRLRQLRRDPSVVAIRYTEVIAPRAESGSNAVAREFGSASEASAVGVEQQLMGPVPGDAARLALLRDRIGPALAYRKECSVDKAQMQQGFRAERFRIGHVRPELCGFQGAETGMPGRAPRIRCTRAPNADEMDRQKVRRDRTHEPGDAHSSRS